MPDYEELEARRLDLAEREIAYKEKLAGSDLDRLQKDSEVYRAKVKANAETNAKRIAAAIAQGREHGELLTRIAVALEQIAESKGEGL